MIMGYNVGDIHWDKNWDNNGDINGYKMGI